MSKVLSMVVKNIKPLNLGALISMVRLGLVGEDICKKYLQSHLVSRLDDNMTNKEATSPPPIYF